MASLAAKAVAREVLENIGKGKKASITKIAIEKGYSYKTANAGEVQKTASYKAIIDPAIDKMMKFREKALSEMLRKDLSGEELETLSRTAARATHDIQLLSGRSTENVSVEEDRKVLFAVIDQLRLPHKE